MDAMRGEATLFTRDDEVEAQWAHLRPDPRGLGGRATRRCTQYEAGTDGPEEAAQLLARRAGTRWRAILAARGCDAMAVMSEQRLVRARHQPRPGRGGAARAAEGAPRRDRGLRARAGAQPGRDRRRRLARRDRRTGWTRSGCYHASRTILCSVQEGRDTIDALGRRCPPRTTWPTGEVAVAHEHVTLEIGERHLKALDTIVDPLVVSDLATLVWAPHGHHEGVDALASWPRSSSSTR